MSRFRRLELIEDPFCYTPPFFIEETSIFTPRALTFPSFVKEDLDVGFALDLLNSCPLSSPFQAFDTISDLVRVHRTPSLTCKPVQRVERLLGNEFYLQCLSDRVAELESRFDRLVGAAKSGGGDRKYTWTAEIKGLEKCGFDRKYKWETQIVEGEKKEKKKKKEKEKGGIAKNFKWKAEIKAKGEDSGSSRKYTFEVESGDGGKKEKDKEKGKKDEKKGSELRIVEIEEPSEHKPVVLRQAFVKKYGALQNNRGKRKELSPQDAALLIQLNFRAYLIRRSKTLRALRELAVAKSKLREIRAQFNNFAYRRRIARDAEELQRFAEKIIVLLLTVDAIEGADFLVRSAKRSMVDELEAMLDVVDPQPGGRSLSIKRRTFDLPDGVIQKEIAESVAQVVQMLDQPAGICG